MTVMATFYNDYIHEDEEEGGGGGGGEEKVDEE